VHRLSATAPAAWRHHFAGPGGGGGPWRGKADPVAAGSPAGTHNPSGSPLREAEAAELRARLKEAILSLPEYYRSVVVLRDIEGLSYREIASVLGCPEGTVMSRLFYAKRALREKLRSYVEG
jgi:DNA-directed RNA polymerase specialized sigma subunit, sigma24 homolog